METEALTKTFFYILLKHMCVYIYVKLYVTRDMKSDEGI